MLFTIFRGKNLDNCAFSFFFFIPQALCTVLLLDQKDMNSGTGKGKKVNSHLFQIPNGKKCWVFFCWFF